MARLAAWLLPAVWWAPPPEVVRPVPDATASRRECPAESEVHCRAGAAGSRRAGPVPQDDAAARRAVRAVAVRLARLSAPRVRAAVARLERPWELRGAQCEGLPAAGRAAQRAAAAERDARAPVQPSAEPAVQAVRVARPSVEPVALPSERREAQLSVALWALPSGRARPARRTHSQRSAPPCRRTREAATATAPRSRWWQEGAV